MGERMIYTRRKILTGLAVFMGGIALGSSTPLAKEGLDGLTEEEWNDLNDLVEELANVSLPPVTYGVYQSQREHFQIEYDLDLTVSEIRTDDYFRVHFLLGKDHFLNDLGDEGRKDFSMLVDVRALPVANPLEASGREIVKIVSDLFPQQWEIQQPSLDQDSQKIDKGFPRTHVVDDQGNIHAVYQLTAITSPGDHRIIIDYLPRPHDHRLYSLLVTGQPHQFAVYQDEIERMIGSFRFL